MNVSELIKWLETQDQGATVEVVCEKDDTAEQLEFTPSFSRYTDLRGNWLVTPDKPYYNARTLLLGEISG